MRWTSSAGLEVYSVLLTELPPKHLQDQDREVYFEEVLGPTDYWMLDYPDTLTYWVRSLLMSGEFGLTMSYKPFHICSSRAKELTTSSIFSQSSFSSFCNVFCLSVTSHCSWHPECHAQGCFWCAVHTRIANSS